MLDNVVKLLVIINNRVIDNDGYSIDTELPFPGRNYIEIEFFRIYIRNYNVIYK